ncbi:nuclear transport factor 2 family protein [Streptomyces pseudogriseolus]|uniref:nuclear transport factor 2 family protein n=1 Tax=Streptomyces pseudogriseolus TaxID=36817 RepID=UPI003FA21022
MTTPTPIRTAARQAFLDHLAAGRVDEWTDLFTEDGVLEFPYAPPGYPTRLQGRDELRAHMAAFPRRSASR